MLGAFTKPSGLTVEEPKPSAMVHQDVSDAESLDDDVIRHKIQEANQLIERVKRALGRIKAIKAGDDSAEGESDVCKSNSTDIEETIEKLKKETALLITGDETAISKESNDRIKEIRSNDTIGGVDSCLELPADIEDIPRARGPIGRSDVEVALERPRTRRNEADDEQLRMDRFRTAAPRSDPPEVSSSIEELQAKLQTISESTESTYSTPRRKLAEPDRSCKCSSTEPPQTEHKGVQVVPDRVAAEVCCSVIREDKCVQAGSERVLSASVTVESLSPRPKPLKSQNLVPQEIMSGKRTCTSCRAEYLPVLELLPAPEKQICEKCRVVLSEEHFQGVSLLSKAKKIGRLSIKVLPPIVIKQPLILTQVLNFSIEADGAFTNRIPNAENVTFVEINHLTFSENPSDEEGEEEEEGISNSGALAVVSSKFNNDLLKDSDKKVNFEKEHATDTLCKRLRRPTPADDEETRRKMLVYKSYQIYDNPNQHDPGHLDQKSMEKISQMDLEFYRTFINPDPAASEEIFTTSSRSKHNMAGFESKTVQCTESMLLSAAKSDELNKSRAAVELTTSEELKDLESQLTVSQVKSKEAAIEGGTRSKSATPEGGNPESSESSPSEITVTVSYTPSSEETTGSKNLAQSISEVRETEIASVIYPASSLHCCSQSKKNWTEDKPLVCVRKDVSSTLKPVDTCACPPTGAMNCNCSTLDHIINCVTPLDEAREEVSQQNPKLLKNGEKNPTVNYLLNADDTCAKRLTVGKNGRYRDEEKLFTQTPYPVWSLRDNVEHKDQEIARDKFPTVPRYRLKRYSPEASNSDTVTTNSLSEGEILCRHSVSNGEIHVCRHNPRCPRLRKNVSARKRFTNPSEKFDLNDPKVTVEQRRNYFNNWVTYYVRAQDVCDSGTSSCSNNK